MLPFSYAARHLLRDPWRFAQNVAGAALVVFLVFSASAFHRGMESVLAASGSPRNVILLGAGSEESVERSEVPVLAESLAATSIRGIETRLGTPAVSGEVHHMGQVHLPGDGGAAKILLRGITPAAFEVHREARILAGRYPGPGEALAGALAHRAAGAGPEAFAPGARLELEGQELAVSGVFAAPGTVMESELWMDRNELMSLIQRDALSCVVLRLESPEHFAGADLFCKQRLDLEMVAVRESDYYAQLSRFYGPIRAMAWMTAGLVGAGAAFGGLNLLYAAFASRMRELATLQAIGFSRGALLFSLVQESLLSTLAGTLLAAYLAAAVLDGVSVPFSIGTFHLQLVPEVIAAGLLAGLLLGSLGALPPALHCLAKPLPAALRSG